MAADKEHRQLRVNRRWCKGCGICVEFCPKGVLTLEKQKIKIVYPEKCIQCGLCEMRCPDYAIWLGEAEDNG